MALLLEVAPWISWRFALDDKDFNRVTDLSSIGFIILVVQQFDRYSFHAVYSVLELAPFVLYALLALQVYSTFAGVKFTALFLSVRRAAARGHSTESRSIDLRYPFFLLCLISASGGREFTYAYYIGVCVLGGFAVWHHRPRTYRPVSFVVLMLLAMALGFGTYQSALKARWLLEPIMLDWFQNNFWRSRNPFRGYTAIGSIGRLKQSDRIILRVKPDVLHQYPRLLREATYQSFSHNTWLAGGKTFSELEPVSEGTVWNLASAREPHWTVDIAAGLHRGKGLVSVPNGAFRLERLGVEDLGVNSLGTLKVNRGPGLINYRVRYDPRGVSDETLSTHDLHVPSYFEGAFHERAKRLGLLDGTVAERLNRLRRFFQDEFSYSLDLKSTSNRPLINFLDNTRSGHCEYFATATVLLLRAAGIRTRYATGYSVQEYSELEEQFVVRKRHAHSWALVYMDGRWQDFDTTPLVWGDLEAAQAPWWESLADVFSFAGFQFSRWRWSDTDDEPNQILLWLLLPLVLIFAWRVALHQRVKQRQSVDASSDAVQRTGLHSAFYRIVNALDARGFRREPGETLHAWLSRSAASGEGHGFDILLHDVLPLHYRCRFDASGFTQVDQDRLRELVSNWMSTYGGD